MKRRAIGLSLLMLSACVAPQKAPPPAPPPPPAPAPAPSPPPPPPADWRDRALTPGDWRYQRTAMGGEAVYGAGTAVPRLAFRCARASGQIWLVWPGAPAATLAIRTTETSAVRTGALNGAELQLAFAARDPILDQMAYSRGRFMLTAGQQALILPPWPELSRVIEDCR